MRLKKPIVYIFSIFILCLILMYIKNRHIDQQNAETTKKNAFQQAISNT